MDEVVHRECEKSEEFSDGAHEQEDLAPTCFGRVSLDERDEEDPDRHRADDQRHERRHPESHRDECCACEDESGHHEREDDCLSSFTLDAVEVDLHPHEKHQVDEAELREKIGGLARVDQAKGANGEAEKNFGDRGGDVNARRDQGHEKRPRVKDDEGEGFSQLHALGRGARVLRPSSDTW